jgi:hypothetical protein
MYSSNGCSNNVLVLQKMFWTKFGTAFPIIHLSIWDMLSGLTRQLIIARAEHFTFDCHLCWLRSKKIKLSTITAVQYSVIVWFSEYSKYTVSLVCSSTGEAGNFRKYDTDSITSFGVPYDYGSVMHYGPYAFSWNGRKTIQPRVSQLSIYFWYQRLCSQAGFVVLY